MKKVIFLLTLIVVSFSSCENKDEVKTQTEIVKKSKYDLQIFEIDSDSYSLVLEQTTGRVFISKNNTSWYEATHESPLPKEDFNCYSMNVKKEMTPKGIVPKIILFNQYNSEIYVYLVDNVANFYSVMSPFDDLK